MIGVLTYDVPHRKTFDTLCLLKAKGYQDIYVWAIPMNYKKTFYPNIQHRPSMPWDVNMEKMCSNLRYDYRKILRYDAVNQKENDIMLVCGAGIMPDFFIKKYRIINAHPGYIPNCRGLDALKWAIYNEDIIGVTTHIIGDEIDAGEILIRKKIPVFKNDTFHLVAQRVYESEIQMLVDSVNILKEERKRLVVSGEGYKVNKRMPHDLEKDLYSKFEKYKNKFAEDREDAQRKILEKKKIELD
jgi:Folate-dependent phosphoribosylglycinamide formyltransferase PurN